MAVVSLEVAMLFISSHPPREQSTNVGSRDFWSYDGLRCHSRRLVSPLRLKELELPVPALNPAQPRFYRLGLLRVKSISRLKVIVDTR